MAIKRLYNLLSGSDCAYLQKCCAVLLTVGVFGTEEVQVLLMRVISKSVVPRSEFIKSTLPVFALAADEQAVRQQLMEPLRAQGFAARLVLHEPEHCQSLPFVNELRALMAESRCGIMVFSRALLQEQYRPCHQMLFYEYGLLEGQGAQVYPLLLDATANELKPIFSEKPLANVQGVADLAQICEQLQALHQPRECYFANPELNNLVLERVRHVQLTVIVDIWRSVLLDIWTAAPKLWAREKTAYDQDVEQLMLDKLFEHLRLGVQVLRFGKQETFVQEAFAPYLPESVAIEFDSPAQFDKTIEPKRMEYEHEIQAAGATDIIARTLKLEFVVPVHDVLGTSYMPYLEIKLRSPWKIEHLKQLLIQSGRGLAGGIVLNPEDCMSQECSEVYRLYFLLPAPTVDVDEPLRAHYGRRCNFIYPK
jgi:hypothetical protein